jgi:hypothetical protein
MPTVVFSTLYFSMAHIYALQRVEKLRAVREILNTSSVLEGLHRGANSSCYNMRPFKQVTDTKRCPSTIREISVQHSMA